MFGLNHSIRVFLAVEPKDYDVYGDFNKRCYAKRLR